jgi:hypothetical protein
MWCAYAFAIIAFISLPKAIHTGTSALISWIAQTFLQLVLLSIIIVGQKVEGAAVDTRADETYKVLFLSAYLPFRNAVTTRRFF